MQVDRHQEIRHLIDRSLVGATSSQEEQTLREHLLTCVTCQEYLNASHQAIAGLGGFSFEVNPDLHGKVLAALTLRAQQLESNKGPAKTDGVELPGRARAHRGGFIRCRTI